MIRLFLLFIFINILYADIRAFGEKADIKPDKVFIYDSFMIYNNMLISAKNIIYDKKNGVVFAKGDVYVNYDKQDYILSDYLTIELKTKAISASPFFIFNFDDNSWISSRFAKNRDDDYFADTTVASTCDINNPDWKIVSSSVQYNKQKKWIDMKNPVLYIKDIPILYLPYLGYSLNKTRNSGFLRPQFGYSANEGFLFTEPYYQTLGLSADLEIAPTIRTKRGQGVYSTFRFVNSETSKGSLKVGSFTDYQDYTKQYNLANKKHYGWQFNYTNREIFRDNDKLYIDLKNANDVDYFYLDAYNTTFNTSYLTNKVLTSTINYYTKDSYNYFGIYGKYFKDTSKLSNSDTMQLLPQLNYHRFSDTFLDNFLYSIDSNIYNYTRNKGYSAIKKNILLPIVYNINFFKDYLKLGITEQFAYNEVDTSDGNVSNNLSLDTFVKLYSNLSKNYNTFSHHIAPSITIGMNNYSKINGESEYSNSTNLTKSLSFKLSQYLISENWNVRHNISEVYYIDDKSETTNFSDLRNDFLLNYNNYYFNEVNRLSIKNYEIWYNSIKIGFNNGKRELELNHIYQKDKISDNKSESIGLKGYFKPNNLYKMFANYNYDLVLDMEKYYSLGISMRKKCWNYSISYKKETIPLLTNDGISSIIQKTIYFEIELVPLGGFQQQYQFKPEQKG